MIDNVLLHHFFKEKCMIFYENSEILSKKEFFGLWFMEKHQSGVNKFWQAVKQGSHFSIIFNFYMQVLILSKGFENFDSQKEAQLSETMGVLYQLKKMQMGPSPYPLNFKIFIYHPIFMKFCSIMFI